MIVNSKKDVIHLVRKRQCNLHLWEYVFYKILKICSKVKKLIGIVCWHLFDNIIKLVNFIFVVWSIEVFFSKTNQLFFKKCKYIGIMINDKKWVC